MSNSSIARNDKFGATLGMANGAQIQVVALADVNGNLIQTSSAGTGVSSLSSPGALTQLTYISAARTTSNAGDSFDSTLLNELAVDATVTTFTGGASPTITFFVDRFGADAVWYRLWTSSAISSPGAVSINIGPFPTGTGTSAGVMTQLTRFGWTFANSPTSITFSASVVGR